MTRSEISRTRVRTVWCLACGANPGQPCEGVRRTREANHRERIETYKLVTRIRERLMR